MARGLHDSDGVFFASRARQGLLLVRFYVYESRRWMNALKKAGGMIGNSANPQLDTEQSKFVKRVLRFLSDRQNSSAAIVPFGKIP